MKRERLKEHALDVDPLELADRLGLDGSPQQKRKHGCPFCVSSDALHLYAPSGSKPGRAKCFSCGESGDVIKLVRNVLDVGFDSALEWITGMGVDEATDTDTPDDSYEPTTSSREPVDDADWKRGARQAYNLFDSLYNRLSLDERALDYLTSHRGIEEWYVREFGVKSITRRQLRSVVDTFDEETLRAAGFSSYYLRPDWNAPPDRDQLDHALVFPYVQASDRGLGDTLRFREIEPGAKVRSLASSSLDDVDEPGRMPHRPTHPYLGWCSMEAARTWDKPLYIVEGEIDALSMAATERPVTGTPSAHMWRPEWCDGWQSLSKVVVLADGDQGGRTLAEKVTEVAMERFGQPFITHQLETRQVHVSGQPGDANDTLVNGQLSTLLTDLEEDIYV